MPTRNIHGATSGQRPAARPMGEAFADTPYAKHPITDGF
jgi:hypothetical protein